MTGLAVAFAMLGVAVLAVAYLHARARAATAMAEARHARLAIEALPNGIILCRGLQIVEFNSAFRTIAGIDREAGGDLLVTRLLADRGAIDRLLSGDEVKLETELVRPDGALHRVAIAARPFDVGGGSGHLLVVDDIHDREDADHRISFLAHHDALTRLPNREVLRARLDAAIARCDETGSLCAVLWIDLDHFKEVNDLKGHTVGDRLLCYVADKLRFEVPSDGLVARVGGDEFVVLCENIADASEVKLIAQQLRRRLNRPFLFEEQLVPVGASIGVAVYPRDAASAEELLHNADLALYRAKAEGRGRSRHFSSALGEEIARRSNLAQQIDGAITDGQIETWFQPVVDARTGTISAFEALARWPHPDYGMVGPLEFIRIAEETGAIPALTDLVIRNSIKAAANWPQHVRVAVNVSPSQINSELVDQVRTLIQASGFDPRRLELEVTEDVLIKDFDQASSMFARLRALGVTVAMDDFGAGYTSISNLRQLNFDRIKIDRIFTSDLPNHRRSVAIVRGIVGLARHLDLRVTVEGVETAEQVAFLRGLGCDELQGFLFSRPLPAAEFADVADWRHSSFAAPLPRQMINAVDAAE
ncbi:EAL domain-containing protein [Starkeya sp. ORNL1]|uniref:putative bifunctional diguanylate cyclase/phosphodiesterase n=1 Tax=Starkeya sp. ORNL1 TaxID=2709380 RepID=UPI0014635E08|nr:EAL domain-containing protein [Starkeya sp. ORNL1]QJP15227.1 EAL domain-containing protein [Starkeya sp. ORNL1]